VKKERTTEFNDLETTISGENGLEKIAGVGISKDSKE